MKYNNIAVWDLTFYRLDDEGNPLTDKEGRVITYDVKDYDCSDIADGLVDFLDVKDLEERAI